MSQNVYKTLFEDAAGDAYWFHTAADIAYFDGADTVLLADESTVASALSKVDTLLSNRVSVTPYYATIGTTFEGSAAPYTQTINVSGITASDDPIVGLIVDTSNAETGKAQEKAYGYVSRITTGTGYITVYCNNKKPDVDLNIKLLVFRTALIDSAS